MALGLRDPEGLSASIALGSTWPLLRGRHERLLVALFGLEMPAQIALSVGCCRNLTSVVGTKMVAMVIVAVLQNCERSLSQCMGPWLLQPQASGQNRVQHARCRLKPVEAQRFKLCFRRNLPGNLWKL